MKNWQSAVLDTGMTRLLWASFHWRPQP